MPKLLSSRVSNLTQKSTRSSETTRAGYLSEKLFKTMVMSHNLLAMILPPFEVDPNMDEFVIDPLSGEKIPYEPDDQGLGF